MAREHRSSVERFKYGMCLNDECPMCKSKTVQQIPMRKELVCSECGKDLRECTPPKKTNKTPLIMGAIAAVAVVGGIVAATCMGGSTEPAPLPSQDTAVVDSVKTTEGVEKDTVVKRDTVVVRDTIVKNNTVTTSEKVTTKTVVNTTTAKTGDAKSTKVSGSISLGYAKFTGSMKAGKPDGQGRMTFTSSHIIDSRDPKGRVAEAGDYVIGEWKDGKLVQGRWYGADGNVKSSIMIGL